MSIHSTRIASLIAIFTASLTLTTSVAHAAKSQSEKIIQTIRPITFVEAEKPMGQLSWTLESRATRKGKWKSVEKGSADFGDCKGCARGISAFQKLGLQIDGTSNEPLVFSMKNVGVALDSRDGCNAQDTNGHALDITKTDLDCVFKANKVRDGNFYRLRMSLKREI